MIKAFMHVAASIPGGQYLNHSTHSKQHSIRRAMVKESASIIMFSGAVQYISLLPLFRVRDVINGQYCTVAHEVWKLQQTLIYSKAHTSISYSEVTPPRPIVDRASDIIIIMKYYFHLIMECSYMYLHLIITECITIYSLYNNITIMLLFLTPIPHDIYC